MSKTACKIEEILTGFGCRKVETSTNGAVVDEKYAVDLSILDQFDLTADRPQMLVSTRKVLYKNEYHNEELTQVQLTVLSDLTGLGTVKALGEKFAEAYCGEAKNLQLRPQFIYQVVPAIELIVDGNRFAAGGMVRPEVLKKKGLKAEKDSIYAVSFIAECVEAL